MNQEDLYLKDIQIQGFLRKFKTAKRSVKEKYDIIYITKEFKILNYHQTVYNWLPSIISLFVHIKEGMLYLHSKGLTFKGKNFTLRQFSKDKTVLEYPDQPAYIFTTIYEAILKIKE